ncbi:MAG: YxeA family protein [Lactobacillus sp.]|nr:YxeA family protein [Lactobacillus sp.]
MKKLGLTIIVVVTILCAALLLIHNQYTDYLNPMIKMETDYAKVPKHTQKYYNVQAIDKSGKKLPYKIKYVGGNDPSRQYIVIRHKGQYVKVIDYITKNEMPRLQD